MGFFSFFKKNTKNSDLDNILSQFNKENFPQGNKDIDAGTKEVLFILNDKIPESEARTIFLRSFAISRISNQFDCNRLKQHLSGYCLQHFTDNQVDKLFTYLKALNAAKILHGRTPADITRNGDTYIW